MKIFDRLYSHLTSVRSLTRRMSEQPTGPHAFSDFERAEIDEDKKYHNTFAKFLGIDQVLVEQIRLKQVQMPVKTPLEIASTLTNKSKPSSPRELSPLQAIAPPTVEAQTVEPPTAQPLTVEPPAVEVQTVAHPTVEVQTVEPPTAQPLTVEPPAVETLATSSTSNCRIWTVEPPTAEPLTVEPPAVETLTTSSTSNCRGSDCRTSHCTASNRRASSCRDPDYL